MKKIIRLDDNDLCKIVAEYYNVMDSKVTATFTEECVGYGEGEHYKPVFYIEVEQDNAPIR